MRQFPRLVQCDSLWFVELEPEEQLCRMLAREKLTGKMRARTIELLASPIRWPLFLEHARNHDSVPSIRAWRRLALAVSPIRSDPVRVGEDIRRQRHAMRVLGQGDRQDSSPTR